MHVAVVTPAQCTALTVAILRVKFSNQIEEQSSKQYGRSRHHATKNTGLAINCSQLLMKPSSSAAEHINIDILPAASKGPSASQEIVVLMVQ